MARLPGPHSARTPVLFRHRRHWAANASRLAEAESLARETDRRNKLHLAGFFISLLGVRGRPWETQLPGSGLHCHDLPHMMSRRFGVLCGTVLFMLLWGGCGYRLGQGGRQIPGGYTKISIPVFKNKSFETGFEVPMTNALISQFARSKVAEVVSSSQAQATVKGTIDRIAITSAQETTAIERPGLPREGILTTGYRMVVTVSIEVVRSSDEKTLWTGQFSGETSYSGSQVTLPGLNSVNPLYNQSAKEMNIERVAKDMMVEVHDRMTENF